MRYPNQAPSLSRRISANLNQIRGRLDDDAEVIEHLQRESSGSDVRRLAAIQDQIERAINMIDAALGR